MGGELAIASRLRTWLMVAIAQAAAKLHNRAELSRIPQQNRHPPPPQAHSFIGLSSCPYQNS